MQAIVQANYNGIDGLQIEARPDPAITPLAVKIATAYTPVMPYDVLTEIGALQAQRPVRLPMVVGYGFSGVVIEVGHLRSTHLLGQRVIGMHFKGTSQTQLITSLPLVPVPPTVSLAAATTLIGGADAALMATRASRATSGEVFLVTGASGSVGTYLVQLLRQLGVTVVAIGHSSKRALLTTMGAAHVLAYDDPLSQQLAALPVIHKIIDLVGSTELLAQLTQSLGTVPIWSLANPDYQARGQTYRFISGRISRDDYRWLLTQLEQKKLRAVIQSTYSFTAVKTAQHALRDQHSNGRILLAYH